MTASQKRMKFAMETLSIFLDWRQDCFRAILHRFWNGCIFHLRQLIVRVRSRLCWRNLCCKNSFILSSGIRFVEDETNGLLFIQHCLVSVNKSWVSPILSITHLQNDCSFRFFRLRACSYGGEPDRLPGWPGRRDSFQLVFIWKNSSPLPETEI